MRRIAAVLAAVFAVGLALAPGAGRAFDRTVREGGWSLQVPFALKRLPVTAMHVYKQEVGGPNHTVVLQLSSTVMEGGWSDAILAMPPEARAVIMAVDLRNFIEGERRALELTPLAPESRFSSVSSFDMPLDLLPEDGVCAGYGIEAVDVMVPGHGDAAHPMRGYQLFCGDFVDETNEIHTVALMLTERHCAELGEKPMADFDGLARRIFTSLRFEAGPPHRLPGTGEGSPGHLTGLFGDGPSALRAALAEAADRDRCTG